jgi:tryptophanyl-tRNA synthetase
VPVGEDQVSHVELSREIVRRFNSFFAFVVRDELFEKLNENCLKEVLRSTGITAAAMLLTYPFSVEEREKFKNEIRRRITERGLVNYFELYPSQTQWFENNRVLSEPEVMLTQTPRIPGLDGRKMSKSYGNAITLSETDEEIRKKTKVMVTDPARKRRTDPGNPDVCPVYDWHKLFSTEEPGRLEWVRQGCTTAGIGCIECKAAMAENLIKWIAPVRERRVKWENDPKGVLEILDAGSKKARVVAQGTMERVREAVFGWGKKRAEIGGAAGKA